VTTPLCTLATSFLSLSLGVALEVAVIPTFIPGCEQFPPHITSRYLIPGKPTARGPRAAVDVYLHGQEPPRYYAVIGEVQVLTRSRNTSLSNMIDYASDEARKMGGGAIVDVWPRAVPGPGGASDPQGRRLLTAKIVRWSARG
jgi:hypothetical protein